MPGHIVDAATGRELFDAATIRRGQNVWQSIGGQEVGSIWGHGAYVAPDWSADWLHRESVLILNDWARKAGYPSFEAAPAETQAALRARLVELMRTNRYDGGRDEVPLTPSASPRSNRTPPTTPTSSRAAATPTRSRPAH